VRGCTPGEEAGVALTEITEETTAYLTVTFYDKNGAASAPASATYQVHDVESGTVMKASTAITPIAATVEIELPGATVNALVNQSNQRERRRVTVTATYGTSDTLNSVYDYLVVGLEKIT
jgi:archaellum component FlaG (FlaF/FlaG flagellin family)